MVSRKFSVVSSLSARVVAGVVLYDRRLTFDNLGMKTGKMYTPSTIYPSRLLSTVTSIQPSGIPPLSPTFVNSPGRPARNSRSKPMLLFRVLEDLVRLKISLQE